MVPLVLTLHSWASLLSDGLLGGSVDLDWLLSQIEHSLADNWSRRVSAVEDVTSGDRVPAYFQGGTKKP